VRGEQRVIGKHRDRFLHGVVVVGGQQHGGAVAVAGDLEPLVSRSGLLDQLGEL
jgi:hypothetical protein